MSKVQVTTEWSNARKVAHKAVVSQLGSGWVLRVGDKYVASVLTVDEALRGLKVGRWDRVIERKIGR